MATYHGIYRGVVLSATDPTGQGRVQVLVPAVPGQTSGWALPCQPAGSNQLPNIGDFAWIIFEGGNPHMPVYMGMNSGSF